MFRFKITTQYGEYNSILFEDKDKNFLVKEAKSALTDAATFQMLMDDEITFIIGKKLLETSQFQIEHLEDTTTDEKE